MRRTRRPDGAARDSLSALFTVLAATALGAGLLRDRAGDFGLRFMAGAALLSLSVFGLCAAGLAYPWVFAVAGAAVVLAWRRDLAATKIAMSRIHLALAPAFASISSCTFSIPWRRRSASTAPGIIWDWSAATCASMDSSASQTTCTPPFAGRRDALPVCVRVRPALGGGDGALRVSAGTGVADVQLCALAGFPVAGAAGHCWSSPAPWWGSTARAPTTTWRWPPSPSRCSTLLQWSEERIRRLLAGIGLVAGFAYATKYTAWLAVPYAVGFRRVKSRRSVLVAACARRSRSRRGW